MIYVGTVDRKGLLEGSVRKMIANQLATLPGKTVKITVVKMSKTITDKQRNFFNGPFLNACVAMYHDAGNVHMDKDDVKEDLKKLYGLTEPFIRPDGEHEDKLKSTEEYSTVEIETFMEQIRAHFAPFGYPLPFPNEAL